MERLMYENQQKTKGRLEMLVEYNDGTPKETRVFENMVVKTGRRAIAKGLANDIGDSYDFFISRMLFGDGGTTGGNEKFVSSTRNGLFGITRANKSVIASVSADEAMTTITSVLSFDDANGYLISEMALQMNDGDLYSMVTFPGWTKTDKMQLTLNWSILLL